MTDDQEPNRRIQSRKKPKVRKPVIQDNTASSGQSQPETGPQGIKGTEEGTALRFSSLTGGNIAGPETV